jgi:hypothetical protein
MTSSSICEFDFEKWALLASSDPESFEQLRHDKIMAVIEKATSTHQQRLRKLQWRIDQVRNKNKTSTMAACLAISDLMWDTFERLNEALQLQGNSRVNSRSVSSDANIIPFPGATRG